MVLIFAETHKQIARNINKEISRIYNIELDEKKLVWGSVLPDYSPKYKLHRHYADESLDFIVNEINILIFLGRFIDIENEIFDGLSKKIFSRKLGIISHYLADFVCRPHYDRMTFNEAIIKHVKYEKNLNSLVENYKFRNNGIANVELKTADDGFYKLKPIIKKYILDIIEEYADEISPERDLEFAYNLNLKMFYFVLDTIKLFNCEKSIQKAFVF